VSPAISRFETDWFTLQVVQEQFAVHSKGPVTPLVRDLVTSIFSLIDQTPVTAFGLNFSAHFRMPTADAWHKVGDTLAPKELWYKFYPEDSQSVGLSELSIEIDPGKRGEPNTSGRRKRLSVSYSKLIPNGVFFNINNHYPVVVDKKSKDSSADVAVRVISTEWDNVMNDSKQVFSGILTEIAKREK
jgi:hypothetical protein